MALKWSAKDQNLLEEKLKNGPLNDDSNSFDVKMSDKSFEKYSLQVLAHRLKEAKKKIAEQKNAPSTSSSSANSSSSSSPALLKLDTTKSTELNSGIVVKHPGVVKWTHFCHELKQKKIYVALNIPSGADDISWEFNDGGDSITVICPWSRTLFCAERLFADELKQKKVSMTDPKVHALRTELLVHGISATSCPKSEYFIPLGDHVLTDDDKWVQNIVEDPDGTKILVLEFRGQEEVLLKKEKRIKLSKSLS